MVLEIIHDKLSKFIFLYQNINTMTEQQKQLGRGAFSVVLRSTTGQLTKRPLETLSQKKRSRVIEKYRNQMQILKRLHQENPTKSHLFGQIYQVNPKGQSIMKDLGDTNLMDAINRRYNRLFHDLDHVMEQLINTVVVMLKAGVVHRDIKPENIMVRYDEDTGHFHLTFVDFTDALTKDDIDTSQQYMNFGTPDFMSPQELFRDQQQNWEKGPWKEYMANDLWSLGIVMYILLFRKHPIAMFRELYPHQKSSTFFSLEDVYRRLREDPRLYASLFSFDRLPINKRKNVEDVKALLSFDPNVRLDWWRKKIRQQQQRERRAHQAVSRLLSASQMLEQRQKKRTKKQ